MNSYLAVIERYGSFQGRTSRAEYWTYSLIQWAFELLSFAVVAVLVNPKAGTTAASLVHIFHILPNISVLVRRLHDTDRSGGWFWIPLTGVGVIILFVFLCEAGTPGDNRYGRNPRYPYGQPLHLGAHNQTLLLSPARDPITELERLAKLRANGSLTEGEYQMMKTRALALSMRP